MGDTIYVRLILDRRMYMQPLYVCVVVVNKVLHVVYMLANWELNDMTD